MRSFPVLVSAVGQLVHQQQKKRPSDSMVTVVRNHSYTCVCCVCQASYLRVVFILFKSFELCGYYLRAATIQTMVVSIRRNTVSESGFQHFVPPSQKRRWGYVFLVYQKRANRIES